MIGITGRSTEADLNTHWSAAVLGLQPTLVNDVRTRLTNSANEHESAHVERTKSAGRMFSLAREFIREAAKVFRCALDCVPTTSGRGTPIRGNEAMHSFNSALDLTGAEAHATGASLRTRDRLAPPFRKEGSPLAGRWGRRPLYRFMYP